MIDVKRVGTPTRDEEVLEEDIGDGARTAVTLDHHGLVAAVGVDTLH